MRVHQIRKKRILSDEHPSLLLAMATFLLTWNPKKSDWELPDDIVTLKRKGTLERRWSCGSNKHIFPGDRVFMLRQGPEPRGIIGSGSVTTGSHEDDHWDESRGGVALYVYVAWDTLSERPIIERKRLDDARFSGVHWNSQSSGITIKAEVARRLEDEWAKATGSSFQPFAEEEDQLVFREGAVQTVTINAYERNPHARAACLNHYGTRCSICGFDFGEVYGPAGVGLIHVHHLRSIATIGRRYRINPITDLRPVCPNCHALIHRRTPAFSLEEVAEFLKSQRAR